MTPFPSLPFHTISEKCQQVNEVMIPASSQESQYSFFRSRANGLEGEGSFAQDSGFEGEKGGFHLQVKFKCFSCARIGECCAVNYMNCSDCWNHARNPKSSYFTRSTHNAAGNSSESASSGPGDEEKTAKPRSKPKNVGTDAAPLDTIYYDLLNIPVDANQAVIKKAYYTAAMKVYLPYPLHYTLILYGFPLFVSRTQIRIRMTHRPRKSSRPLARLIKYCQTPARGHFIINTA